MFFNAALVFTVAIASLVAANEPTTKCNTGPIKCCNTVEKAESSSFLKTASLIGGNVGGITGLIGMDCVALVGGASCSGQTVCCDGTKMNGLVNVGCSPVNAHL